MIGELVALISLETTRRLIAANWIAKTLTIIDATNASPIVIETSVPHGFPKARPVHGVVSGVGGNLAANELWVMSYVDATHLSLSTLSPAGDVILSQGSGDYVSGGVLQIAFPEGSILCGRRNVAMQTAVVTPRIVFVPIGSGPWIEEPYGGLPAAPGIPGRVSNMPVDQQFMMLHREILTEKTRFEVHVSACANPPSPDYFDFNITQSLYQELVAVMGDLISTPRARVISAEWVSQKPTIQTLDTHGQKWVGIVEISQPVTDNPLQFIPASTDGTIAVNFLNGTSADETIIVVTT